MGRGRVFLLVPGTNRDMEGADEIGSKDPGRAVVEEVALVASLIEKVEGCSFLMLASV